MFAAAYTKYGSGFGPGGTGAIYEVPASGSAYGAGALPYIDLNAIFGANTAGPDPHPAGTDFSRDAGAYTSVGKTSLGDIKLSADGKTLYVVNLYDQKLYVIPVDGSPINSTTVKRYSIPDITNGAAPSDSRPFGIGINDGLVYVGVVNSAQSTQLTSSLGAAVYAFNPATTTFNATPVLSFPLTFSRGLPYIVNTNISGDWNPWSDTFNASYYDNGGVNREFGSHPEPMLSDIEVR